MKLHPRKVEIRKKRARMINARRYLMKQMKKTFKKSSFALNMLPSFDIAQMRATFFTMQRKMNDANRLWNDRKSLSMSATCPPYIQSSQGTQPTAILINYQVSQNIKMTCLTSSNSWPSFKFYSFSDKH